MNVTHEGVEERGRWFIRWVSSRRLGENHTPVMAKFRQRINSVFYIRYSYAYVLVNVENGLKMVYYKRQSGSVLINSFAAAERILTLIALTLNGCL